MIKKKISIVVPCYNEEKNIEKLYQRLKAVIEKAGCEYEIIFADNKSTDNSRKILRDLAMKDSRVVSLFFPAILAILNMVLPQGATMRPATQLSGLMLIYKTPRN